MHIDAATTELELLCLTPYFSNVVALSVIGGGNGESGENNPSAASYWQVKLYHIQM